MPVSRSMYCMVLRWVVALRVRSAVGNPRAKAYIREARFLAWERTTFHALLAIGSRLVLGQLNNGMVLLGVALVMLMMHSSGTG
jgi:hypothetical protein